MQLDQQSEKAAACASHQHRNLLWKRKICSACRLRLRWAILLSRTYRVDADTNEESAWTSIIDENFNFEVQFSQSLVAAMMATIWLICLQLRLEAFCLDSAWMCTVSQQSYITTPCVAGCETMRDRSHLTTSLSQVTEAKLPCPGTLHWGFLVNEAGTAPPWLGTAKGGILKLQIANHALMVQQISI